MTYRFLGVGNDANTRPCVCVCDAYYCITVACMLFNVMILMRNVCPALSNAFYVWESGIQINLLLLLLLSMESLESLLFNGVIFYSDIPGTVYAN